MLIEGSMKLTHHETALGPFIWVMDKPKTSTVKTIVEKPVIEDKSVAAKTLAKADKTHRRHGSTKEAEPQKAKAEVYMTVDSDGSSPSGSSASQKLVTLDDYETLLRKTEHLQRMAYDLLRGLKAVISTGTTTEATLEIYEAYRKEHKRISNEMRALADVEVLERGQMGL